MSNRLRHESSPYLLQHADNPVDWYPWGAEALAAAKSLDRPIFLSIGYASCHWCHVMAKESFADPAIGQLLNDNFVSIKVDREERPDLDAVYLKAVTGLTGHAGWPLSVWLTPEGVPFFGGTYFPPDPRFGQPSFRQVLNTISHLWQTRRGDIVQAASDLQRWLAAEGRSRPDETGLGEVIDHATHQLVQTFDSEHGGWGTAPKFPSPLVLDFLLTRHLAQPQLQLDVIVNVTLQAMAAGGLYDQLAGGFHRYAVDEAWRIPHFEKMLYDNAQLARCYVHAWQVTGRDLYQEIATETLDYLARDLRDLAGGFYASEDADSQGQEGAYYTWTPAQISKVLDAQEVPQALELLGVTAEGQLAGASVLARTDRRLGPVPTSRQAPDPATVGLLKAKLLRARSERPRPPRDEKILAGWNGLAVIAFAEAATAFRSERYLEIATHAGRFLRDRLLQTTGALAHSVTRGRLSGEGFLDDYTSVALGFLSLYRATFDEEWFILSRRLADRTVARFRAPEEGFFDTGPDHERLIVRPRTLADSPTPAGLSLAAALFLEIAAYTDHDSYRELAAEALSPLKDTAREAPILAGQWLQTAFLAERGLTQVALVGDFESPEGAALLGTVREQFRPWVTYAARPTGQPTAVAMLDQRDLAPVHKAVAWLCDSAGCTPAVSDPVALAALLAYQREPPEREPPP